MILGCTNYNSLAFRLRDCHTLWPPFPERSAKLKILIQDWYLLISVSHNPYITTHTSLHDIGLGSSQFAHHYYGNHFVFSSWRYLDVSVHAVRSFILYIQIKVIWVLQIGFPHSEISGSKPGWRLPEAFSSLPLPSSPPDTKASTKSPFQLIKT